MAELHSLHCVVTQMNRQFICITEGAIGLSLINRSSWDLGPSYKNKLTGRKENPGKAGCLQVTVLFHISENLAASCLRSKPQTGGKVLYLKDDRIRQLLRQTASRPVYRSAIGLWGQYGYFSLSSLVSGKASYKSSYVICSKGIMLLNFWSLKWEQRQTHYTSLVSKKEQSTHK